MGLKTSQLGKIKILPKNFLLLKKLIPCKIPKELKLHLRIHLVNKIHIGELTCNFILQIF